MITEEEVEAELDYLRDNATVGATAKANRIYVTEYRKVLKAKIMKEHPTLSAALQEREAYADPRYEKHLVAIRDAVFHDEKHSWLREAAGAKLSAWQTMSKNYREMKI